MKSTEAERLEQRIRERAYRIWQREGQPDGRAATHWERAEEEIGIEDNQRFATKPNPLSELPESRPYGEPVEPLEAVENQGEFPDVRDQGDSEAPRRRKASAPRTPGAAEAAKKERRRKKE